MNAIARPRVSNKYVLKAWSFFLRMRMTKLANEALLMQKTGGTSIKIIS